MKVMFKNFTSSHSTRYFTLTAMGEFLVKSKKKNEIDIRPKIFNIS